MRSVLAFYVANGRAFLRDRMASLFTFFIPVMFAGFFGAIFSGNSFSMSLGVVNEDSGTAGQQFVTALTTHESQSMLTVKVGSREELLGRLRKGDVEDIFILPTGLTEALEAGQATPIEIYYDSARQTSSGIGLDLARNILNEANLRVHGLEPLLLADPKAIQTRPLRAVDFYTPSLLAMAMLWLGLFGTMQPLVQQREQGVLRRLSICPVRPLQLLAGQVLWRLTVGMVQSVVFVLFGRFVLGIEFQGSWLLFGLAAALGALVFTSMGYALAGISSTVEGAIALAQLVNFPMMFFSGILFEPQMLPPFLRPLMHIMPAAYLGDAFRQTMVDYVASYPLWLDFAVLSGWLVFFVAFGLRFFKWERN